MNWLLALLVVSALAWMANGKRSASLDNLTPKRRLLVLPLVPPGETSSPSASWVADCIVQETGIAVEFREQPMILADAHFRSQAGQGDAVAVVEMLEQLVDQDLAVLGVVDVDLHSPLRKDLPYAMGARKGWAGLISTYRMEDKFRTDNTLERLKKMTVRYAAELACDTKRDRDPQSVFYESLNRPEQLDIMQWPPERLSRQTGQV